MGLFLFEMGQNSGNRKKIEIKFQFSILKKSKVREIYTVELRGRNFSS